MSLLMRQGYAEKGIRVVTQDQEAERRAICSKCEHGDMEAHLKLGACKKCGCSLGKLWMADWECPLPDPDKKFTKIL